MSVLNHNTYITKLNFKNHLDSSLDLAAQVIELTIYDGNKTWFIPNGWINFLPNLETLTVTDAGVKSISRPNFKDMSKLRGLYLSSNEISKVPQDVFHDLASLEFLDMHWNDIQSLHFGTFSKLSQLKFLDFRFNSVAKLAKNLFDNNQKLIYVDFANNNLLSIQVDFMKLKKITFISFEGNSCCFSGCEYNSADNEMSFSDFQKQLKNDYDSERCDKQK